MAYWMVACSVYLFIVTLGVNVRFCRMASADRCHTRGSPGASQRVCRGELRAPVAAVGLRCPAGSLDDMEGNRAGLHRRAGAAAADLAPALGRDARQATVPGEPGGGRSSCLLTTPVCLMPGTARILIRSRRNATNRPGVRCTEGESCPALPPGARTVANERIQRITPAAHALLVGDGIVQLYRTSRVDPGLAPFSWVPGAPRGARPSGSLAWVR